MKPKRIITLVTRALIGLVLSVIALYLLLVLAVSFWPVLSGGTRGRHVKEQSRYAALFRAGNTNVPLLAMDWFSDHGVYFCRVSQCGKVYSARDVSYAIQGGTGISSRFSLDNTNRPLLEAVINSLPGSSKTSLPRERQIVISGIQSNQWFRRVYDRANVPAEVEALYDLTGAYLGWFIPVVGADPEYGRHGMSQHGANSFAIAQESSFAVSICANSSLQIWNLKGPSPVRTATLDKLPYPWKEHANDLWVVAAMSPEGRIVILAVHDVLFAVDWQNQKLLWQKSQTAWGNTYRAGGRTLAVGNGGHSLFVAEGNSIHRFKLADGTKLGTIATNGAGIKFLQTSWNGGLLVAGFGDNSFTIWETEKDLPACHFSEPAEVTCIAISPDNQRIVLSGFGQKTLVVHTWQRGERREFRLRTPYASASACSLCWSPDGRCLAADVDTYPSSVIIYETATWKPIADWPCGAVGSGSEYVFTKKGRLFQLIDGAVNCLDVNVLKAPAH
jgi:WD40 repeat protein